MLALLIKRGLKASTMPGYICAMREDPIARGYGVIVFKKENLTKAIHRGKSNLEASSSKSEKAEITVDLIKKPTSRSSASRGKSSA